MSGEPGFAKAAEHAPPATAPTAAPAPDHGTAHGGGGGNAAATPPPGGAKLDEHAAFGHWGDHPTGNAGIDSAGQGECATKGGAGCFLTQPQRGELNSQVRGLINLTAKNHGLAIEQLRTVIEAKKIDEMGWVASLLLGAAIAVVEAVVPMAWGAITAAGAVASTLAKVGADATAVKVAESEFKTLSKAQLTTTIKAAVSLGKTNAIKSVNTATSAQSEDANAKSAALSHTQDMMQKADVMWSQLIADVGSMDDATALACMKAVDPKLNTVAKFYAECSGELARYAASDVSKIGRGLAYEGNKQVEREVRVAKVMMPGAGVRYAYMDRVFDGWFREANAKREHTADRSGVYDDPEMAFSLEQEADWKIGGKEQRGSEKPLRPDSILSWVEPEFQELAIQKQKDVWLKPIETFQVSYAHGDMRVIKVGGS